MAKTKITIKIEKNKLPKTRLQLPPTCRPHKDKTKYSRKKGKKIDDLPRSRPVAGGVFYYRKMDGKDLTKSYFSDRSRQKITIGFGGMAQARSTPACAGPHQANGPASVACPHLRPCDGLPDPIGHFARSKLKEKSNDVST